MANTNNNPIIKLYKRFNGTAWDKIYFITSANAVYETSSRIFVNSALEKYKGVWSSEVNYSVGEIVSYISSNKTYYYVSRSSGNTNHNPSSDTEGTYWYIYDLMQPGKYNDSAQGQSICGYLSPEQAEIIQNAVSTTGSVTQNHIAVFNASNSSVVKDGPGYGTGSIANNLVQLDSSGKINILQLPDSILGSLRYKGTWNAQTGAINITDYHPIKGDYFICNTEGSRDPGALDFSEFGTDGTFEVGDRCYYTSTLYKCITSYDRDQGWISANWQQDTTKNNYEISDWAVYNGSDWDEIDNQTKVVSVNGRTGEIQTYLGTWVSGASYNTGDILLDGNNGVLYITIANVSNSTTRPSSDTTHFKSLISGAATVNDIIKHESVRRYFTSNSNPYFTRISNDKTELGTITTDISAGFNTSSPNWGVLYEYFRQTIFGMGNLSTDPEFMEGMFISDNAALKLSTKLSSYFLQAGILANDLDSFRVECYGSTRVTAECTCKINLFTKKAKEFMLLINATSQSQTPTYICDGWKNMTNRIYLTSNSTSTSELTNLSEGDVVLETV